MHLPILSLALIPLLPTLTAAVLIVETSTSTYTAAAATSSPPSSSSTSTSTPTTTPTPTPPSIQYTSDTAFESSILNTTNTYRAHHNATALLWNASLATTASSWASQCHFNHSPTHSAAGENLAQDYPNATAAVEAWGDEGRRYDYHKETYSASTGHFSQLVWKGTTDVGCGRVECGGRGGVRGWFVVCEYWPKGNIEGMFGEEVGGVVGLLVVDGDREVGEGLARVVAEVNGGGAGRRGGLRLGLVVVGVGMLGALGL